MRIELRAVSKSYLLKTALHDVNISFSPAKIHALFGENGSGKSTLAGILAGDIQPTSGTVLLDGTPVIFHSAKDARAKGIVLVHQRPLLADSITVKENILLGLSTTHLLKNDRQFVQAFDALKKEWAPRLQLTSFVKDLGGDERFYTSLIGALLLTPQCLILDEPSSFLDQEQRNALYRSLQKLAASGCSIIVITHSTAEATTYADDICMLHEGTLAAPHGDTSPVFPKTTTEQSAPNANKEHPCFSLTHASSRPKDRPALLDATIVADYGTITMVTGMQEGSLGTLEDVVTGMSTVKCGGTLQLYSKQSQGTICFPLSSGKLSASFLRKHHTAMVPSDRTFRASNPNLTVEQMLTVYYNGSNTRKQALTLIKQADIRITPEEQTADLSGGMLQRLILAREQSLQPDFFILCEPMQGLDIQAQASLCTMLVSLADKGIAILVLGAADFPLSLCSRVYTLEGGITTLSFEKKADTKSNIGKEEQQ
jgi:ABC-type uncharacterized transport system ATPase subunit